MPSIPTDMKALVLPAYNQDLAVAVCSLAVESRPMPNPTGSQVLVKMEAAPCNPSDLLFLQGLYGVVKPLPAVPGWEGAGTVVAAGGLRGRWLVGRRVAVVGQGDRDGTWAEYYAADVFTCLPLSKGVSNEQGACLIVNPLTALALLEIAHQKKASAVVQTAAASQVGRMVVRLARDMGITVINVVRRQEQVDLLHELGAEHVLDSSEADFEERLHDTCRRLRASVAFDAVAGSMTGQLASAMPPGSTVFVYGALSEEPCTDISPFGLIFEQKRVEGFYLSDWINQRSALWTLRAARKLQRLIACGKLGTTISHEVSLAEAGDALLAYADNMTAGKVIIKPALD